MHAIFLIAILGSFLSGLVTVDHAGAHLHKEVLKQGQAVYNVNK